MAITYKRMNTDHFVRSKDPSPMW